MRSDPKVFQPPALQQQIYNQNLKALAAGAAIGALACVPGINIAIPIAALIIDAAAGYYSIQPVG